MTIQSRLSQICVETLKRGNETDCHFIFHPRLGLRKKTRCRSNHASCAQTLFCTELPPSLLRDLDAVRPRCPSGRVFEPNVSLMSFSGPRSLQGRVHLFDRLCSMASTMRPERWWRVKREREREDGL